ncbi:hypothetical protein MKW98_009664 [Papaver atlanticum]|uniref:Agglutinin domain-containing protein n=1 Tax=Papaver atlanticum TaxID=357466 RepID=A0AAD4XPX3_9MAGN|nr:hypothetical protein MKW98_009664 [Papaver atlanticum]
MEAQRLVVTLNENDTRVHAIMADTLPKQVIIQSNSNNKYLHFFKEKQIYPNALRYDGDYSFELETRFEVEPATTGTGLVHIRSLMNNKYWANCGMANNWVSAMAAKPEENLSDKRCTLFQPVFMHPNNNRVLKLRHVQTGNYVSFFHGSGHTHGLLAIKNNVDDNSDVCTFIDWKSVVKFPKRIRIKGDNGNYLKAFEGGLMNFNNQVDNSTVFEYEVYPSRDGGIRLRSTEFGTYWSDASYPWIWLKQASSDQDTSTVFLPTIVSNNGKDEKVEEEEEEDEEKIPKKKDRKRKKEKENHILLRSLRTGRFCKRFSTDYRSNCLASNIEYPDEACYMEIDEPITERLVYDVKYNFDDARRYNEKTLALITDESINNTECSFTSSFFIKTTVSNTCNWNTGVTNTLGDKMSLTAPVPKLGEFGYKNTSKVDKSWNWEDTVDEEEEVGDVKTLTVPPKTRVKAFTTGTRLSYDIPFSYTQTDVLSSNNKRETFVMEHGIFTCHNGYGYKYDNAQFSLE